MNKIKLGDEVRDKITGFKGIAVCRADWINGCIRFTVQPRGVDKEGKCFESAGFDWEQLEIIKEGAVILSPKNPPTNGPMPEPK